MVDRNFDVINSCDLHQLKLFGDVSDICNDQGETVMHTAVLLEKLPIIAFLLENYPHMAAVKNKKGETVLHYAVFRKKLHIVETLVSVVPELIHDCTKYNMTPLQHVLRKGFWQAAAVMISYEPESIKQRHPTSRETLLHFAVLSNDLMTVRYLLTISQADVLTSSQNCEGKTPLFLATTQGSLAMVKLLMHANPKAIEIPEDVGLFPICATTDAIVTYLLQVYPQAIHLKNPLTNANVLHMVCQYNSTQIVKMVLELCPALLNEQLKNGETMLQYNLKDYVHRRKHINTILRFKPDLVDTDTWGDTVLHIAVRVCCDPDVICDVFQKCKSNLYCANKGGQTPFCYAVEGADRAVVEMFQPHMKIEMAVALHERCLKRHNIDLKAYCVQSCVMLNNYLLPDIVHIVFEFLGSTNKK